MSARRWLVAALSAACVAEAQAQPSLTAEAMIDYRVRGLSWSGGRPTVGGAVGAELPLGFHGEAWAVAARCAARHGGADTAIDLTAGRRTALGPVSIDTAVVGHLFPGGEGAQDFAEGRIALETTLGPVSATASAAYAPRQQAIGGDNLHLRLATRVGVIGTPYTVRAQVGRSTGDARDPAAAARLRPDDAYLDWLIGVDRIMGPLAIGVAYSDTDIGTSSATPPAYRRHAGAALIGRATFSF